MMWWCFTHGKQATTSAYNGRYRWCHNSQRAEGPYLIPVMPNCEVVERKVERDG